MKEGIEYIYAGLAGRPLEPSEYDLGEGASVTKTYAHIMAPLMAAFTPAPPGRHHPAPWKAVNGGFGFDILSEIKLSTLVARKHMGDVETTLWCIIALIRLRNGPGLIVPALASDSFSAIKTTNEDVTIRPLEIEPRRLKVTQDEPETLSENDLAWVRMFWPVACDLMKHSPEFNLALQAFDQCVFFRLPSLALLSLWASLEGLFSGGRDELRFRISSGMAAFLQLPGLGRLSLQKEIAKLYDARSAAAHGRFEDSWKPLIQTYALTRRTLTKIIEDNHVPTRNELEAMIFGVYLS